MASEMFGEHGPETMGIGGFRSFPNELESIDSEVEVLRVILSNSSVQFWEQGVLLSQEAQLFILTIGNAIYHLQELRSAKATKLRTDQ